MKASERRLEKLKERFTRLSKNILDAGDEPLTDSQRIMVKNLIRISTEIQTLQQMLIERQQAALKKAGIEELPRGTVRPRKRKVRQ